MWLPVRRTNQFNETKTNKAVYMFLDGCLFLFFFFSFFSCWLYSSFISRYIFTITHVKCFCTERLHFKPEARFKNKIRVGGVYVFHKTNTLLKFQEVRVPRTGQDISRRENYFLHIYDTPNYTPHGVSQF